MTPIYMPVLNKPSKPCNDDSKSQLVHAREIDRSEWQGQSTMYAEYRGRYFRLACLAGDLKNDSLRKTYPLQLAVELISLRGNTTTRVHAILNEG